MWESSMKLTTSQFAKLHKLNKRTLHYYDQIGLFSPKYREANNYRYYELSQSMELENILMLKELGMEIGEIKRYLDRPDCDAFIQIADKKLGEIEKRLKRLKTTKEILKRKKAQLLLSAEVEDGQIELIKREEEYILLSPFSWENYTVDGLMDHLMQAWEMEEYKIGCGSYISVEKIKEGNFEEYDGIFTPIQNKCKKVSCAVMPRGKYLCGYTKGNWNKLPGLYKHILEFAQYRNLQLMGYAYEIGLNEFAISDMDEYVTQVLIQVRE